MLDVNLPRSPAMAKSRAIAADQASVIAAASCPDMPMSASMLLSISLGPDGDQ